MHPAPCCELAARRAMPPHPETAWNCMLRRLLVGGEREEEEGIEEVVVGLPAGAGFRRSTAPPAGLFLPLA